VFVHVTDDAETGRRELERFVAGQYGMPVEAVERWCVIGAEDRVADALARYRDVGAEAFVMMPTAVDVLRQYERLASVRDRLAASV
jgi:alkanesulfonate monooxygenase SsuD/methylene tetrahydromethanopterin reductase-like flavin-dependent oxidoreductase (luciferase family)